MPGTVLITNECQRGAIGDEALWPALRDAAAPILPTLKRLVDAARAASVPVIHVLVVRDPDETNAPTNAPLLEVSAQRRNFGRGTPAAELVAGLGDPSDRVIEKPHGMASSRSTGLDELLRDLDADTVALTGVSLNVAIPFLAFEAVSLGYRVVIPSDAVAGVPDDFAQAVLTHTLPLVATVTTSDELSWARQ